MEASIGTGQVKDVNKRPADTIDGDKEIEVENIAGVFAALVKIFSIYLGFAVAS